VAAVPVGLVYEPPSGIDVGHDATAGNTGEFTDSFSPTAPGAWHALAHYNGDANHAPAQATCPFTVAPDDFQISVNPSSGSVQQGSSIDATVETAWP
jgi:hypothetical protein